MKLCFHGFMKNIAAQTDVGDEHLQVQITAGT
jgi:hypothetical protein